MIALFKEFLENCDKEFFDVVAKAFRDLNDRNNKRFMTIQTPQQYVEQGSPAQMEIPFEFDYSNFFV